MSRPRPTIPKRTRFFVAGEGPSEVAFFAAVEAFANSGQPRIHLVRKSLKGGGPISMAERAVREAKDDQRRGGTHKGRWAFLDADTTHGAMVDNVRRVLASEDIDLVLQDPCFEAHLLRHFAGYERQMPPDCAAAETALRTPWPGYAKPPIAQDIQQRIGLHDLRRYAAVEAASYANFLVKIGVM